MGYIYTVGIYYIPWGYINTVGIYIIIYRGDIYIWWGYNIYTMGIYIYRGDIYIYRGDIIYTVGIYIYRGDIYIYRGDIYIPEFNEFRYKRRPILIRYPYRPQYLTLQASSEITSRTAASATTMTT